LTPLFFGWTISLNGFLGLSNLSWVGSEYFFTVLIVRNLKKF
jgi:hypothetical protein